ncbi:mPR-typeG-protein-coupled receptor [Pseudovirgaria hyperparasitica]|uniref:MPR-typeG-protein-coupled receptor n=1 Tax=Pseudovirgaria hyperparasitica TaxID=470096 RepID=A0A6A6W8Y5_9PEZI|nr:mPR-typeG-protein-coupled receptor [Pseudovirgaria hyperparasitica]KAF2758484.1 mPR-typeG-protein-coupled receptor [Pseudovirgaria hyperparasitica]
MKTETQITYQSVPSDPDTLSTLKTKQRLLHFHEIPSWQQENEYLLSGYRPTADSTLDCFQSSFRWHNETINIISHIAGSVLFAALPFHFYYSVYLETPHASLIDFVLFTGYFHGVSICFACSASCHIVWNHSPSIASFGNQLDYLGIVLLMWTASLPSIYYGFICDPTLRYFHWALTTALAAGCIITTMHPRFCTPHFRSYRAGMYTGLGLAAMFFVTHGIMLHGIEIQERRMALKWMLAMASFNIFGAAAYAARVPERLYPYTFDFVGASHQIFHFMVIFAGIAHYLGLIKALQEVREVRQDCNS